MHPPRQLLLSLLLLLCLLAGCAYKNHIKQGDQLYAQGRYDEALTQYEAALARKPDSHDAQLRVSDAKNALISQYTAEARAQLDANDFYGALDAALALEQRLPDAAPVHELLGDVFARIHTEAARRAEREQWAGALELMMLLYDTFPADRQVLDPEISRIKTTWTATLTASANSAEARGDLGDALLLHSQAALLSMAPENVAKRDELRGRLLAEYLYVVSLKGKGGDAEQIVSSLQGGGLVQNMRLVRDSKLPETRATLSLSMKRPRFHTDRSSVTRTVSYVSGTRQVPNPSYANRQDDLAREEKDLYRYEQDVTRYQQDVSRYEQAVAREGDTPGVSTGAEQSLSRARSDLERAYDHVQNARDRVQRAREELQRTDQFTEEDVYSDLDYPVTTHTLRGELPFTVEVAHVDSQRAPLVSNLMATTTASDEEHAAYPIANVSGDPLQLPSERDLERELMAQVDGSARALAVQSFQAWRQELLTQALGEQDQGKRLHLYAIYILIDPSTVDPRVIEEIATSRGIPDAPAVLGAAP